MFNDKQNLYAISTEGSLFGVDCEVITSTNYEEDEVTDFIKIMNHEIDEALVYQLGLGIVSNLHEQEIIILLLVCVIILRKENRLILNGVT